MNAAALIQLIQLADAALALAASAGVNVAVSGLACPPRRG